MQVFFSSNVFFGSSKNKLIKYVTSVIGKKKILLTSVFDKKNKEIEVWPIKLAFFDYKQKKSSPQSQISLELDKNGIVHNYIVNYGDYIMRVGLKKLEKIEPANC